MSLTNVTFPPELVPALRKAVEYYDFENLNQFFRLCGHAIIEHHKRGDKLIAPYSFLSVNGEASTLCKRK